MSRPETPRLDELQAALDRGDLDSGPPDPRRRSTPRSSGCSSRRWGSEAFARARGAAARGAPPREARQGPRPARDHGHRARLGRPQGRLRPYLDQLRPPHRRPDRRPRAEGGRRARRRRRPRPPAGVHRKTYVPLLMELDTRWHVRPFPFDWREDIDKSAARLDGEIKAFGAGEPVHLVAHSMGGLVSRRFIQLFPRDVEGDGRHERAGARRPPWSWSARRTAARSRSRSRSPEPRSS